MDQRRWNGSNRLRVEQGRERRFVFQSGIFIQRKSVWRWLLEFKHGYGRAAGRPGDGQLEQRFETGGGGAKESPMERKK